MVFVAFAHMLRVFYHKAYKPPREFNWVVGVVLFLLTLLLSYTGYLLPWDQLAFWGVSVGTNMVRAVPGVGDSIRYLLLGGNIVGDNALRDPALGLDRRDRCPPLAGAQGRPHRKRESRVA
jgi:quinol-cytochrome oxidoreductase complex cytochrome b subunit